VEYHSFRGNFEQNNVDIKVEEYQKAVSGLASAGSELFFKNSNPLHAAIVLNNIVLYSEKTVRIYDTDLSGDIAMLLTEFETSINDFVRVHRKLLKILVKKKTTSNEFQRFLVSLANSYPENLIIKLANDAIKKEIVDNFERDLNFTVGDESKFRLEYGDNNERKAYCSFNNKKCSNTLVSVFDKHFPNCEKYEIDA